MGKIAAAVARALFGAVDTELNAVVKGNGRHGRVQRLQQERSRYRGEIEKQQGGGKKR